MAWLIITASGVLPGTCCRAPGAKRPPASVLLPASYAARHGPDGFLRGAESTGGADDVSDDVIFDLVGRGGHPTNSATRDDTDTR